MAKVNPGGANESAVAPFFAPAALPFANPAPPARHDPKKWETKKQMQHAAKIASDPRHEDCSKDWAWRVDPTGAVDYYTAFVMLIAMVPKMLVMWPVLILLCAPAVCLNAMYIQCQPRPLVTLRRDGCSWRTHVALQFVLTIPVQIIVAANYVVDCVLMCVFGMLWCTLTLGWCRLYRNLKVIAPYTGGPSLYLAFADCVAAAAGMIDRQDTSEFLPSFALMFVLNPWIKYWLTGNVYLSELDERYVTQIGESMKDMEVPAIDEQFQKCISQAKNSTEDTERIDNAFFCPHYPFPPPGRRAAIGMQQASKVTTFVHTTHFRSPGDAIYSLSTSVELPVYRVMLWRNNPFHIFTGYVEASISHGRPSQPHQANAAEHPMWLVNAHNRFAASRSMRMSVGWIDTFFDKFIPHFQHFVRGNVRGWGEAQKHLEADDRKGYELERAQPGA